jgi:hypothetical protein
MVRQTNTILIVTLLWVMYYHNASVAVFAVREEGRTDRTVASTRYREKKTYRLLRENCRV